MVSLIASAFSPLVTVVALAAAAVSCADTGSSPSPGVEFGAPFEVSVGDAQVVGSEGLSLRFEGVASDSRCPVDVTCFWEGEALVQIRVQAPAQEPRTLDVRVRGTGGSGEGDYAERFKVRVAKLEPAPVSTQPIPASAYKATLVVTKR